MSSWTLYWILMLDNVFIMGIIWLSLVGLATFILSVIAGCSYCDGVKYKDRKAGDEDEDWIRYKGCMRYIKKCIPVLIASSLILTFTPRTKQMAVILVTPHVIEAVEASEIPEALTGLATLWIENLKPKELTTDATRNK